MNTYTERKEIRAHREPWLRDAAPKGGKATGDAKRRGDSAHYKRLSRKAAKARKAKSPNVRMSEGADK